MQSFIEECTRAYSFEGFAIRGYLIFAGSSHELYYIIDMYSLIYYAVPYTYIPLDSFAAQEINRRARATSNDRLCTRWMYASQIHICITRIYTYTHATGACSSAIVHGISFNFLFHACLRLDTPPHASFNRKFTMCIPFPLLWSQLDRCNPDVLWEVHVDPIL